MVPLEPSAELLGLPVGEFLRRQARKFGDRRLATFQDGRSLSYRELDEQSERFASGLLARGLAKGERIALMFPNGPEFLVASYGIAKAGLQEVPLLTGQKAEGVAKVLEIAAVKAVLAAPDCQPLFEATGAERLDFDEIASHRAVRLPTVSAIEPLSVMFTSGTTGLPKGVVRPHRGDVLMSLRAAHLMRYGRDDVVFSVFPLAHINAKVNTLMGVMHMGGSAVLHERFSASAFWESTRRHGATSATFQGAMLEILWKTRQATDRDNPVATGRAAPVPVALHRDFEEYFGIRLFEAYGFSEAGIVAFNRERRPGSFGTPVREHFEIALLDEEDYPVPRGRPGLLAIRPRIPYSMFSGYLGMPEYTLGATRNLWFHTGDLVVEDADGHLSFVRRESDAIRRRGENISPLEVERAVAQVPGVLECAAYGVPSELTEEEVMVAVVRDAHHAGLDPEGIARHCEEALPRFAVPRFIRFVEAIPKNDSQKALRRALKAEGVTPDTWERRAR